MRALLIGLVGAVLAVGTAGAKDIIYDGKGPIEFTSPSGRGRVIKSSWQGHLTLKPIAPGKFSARYIYTSEHCIGEFGGVASEVSASEIHVLDSAPNGKQCKVKIMKSGSVAVLSEEPDGDCFYLHGAGCGFSQSLKLKR